MRLAICVFFLLALFGVNAAESLKVLNVNTHGLKQEIDGELFLDVDDVTSKALGLHLFDHTDGKTKEYDVNGLSRGVTLKQIDGRRVLILRSQNFNANVGGDFNLIYLNEGKLNKSNDVYRQISLRIQKESKDFSWRVYNNGREIKGLNLMIKKILFKVVGIDRIKIDYK